MGWALRSVLSCWHLEISCSPPDYSPAAPPPLQYRCTYCTYLLSPNPRTSPELLLYIYIIFKLRDHHRIFAPLKLHNLKFPHQEASSTVVGPLAALPRDPHSNDNSLKYTHTHSVVPLCTHSSIWTPTLCVHSRRHSETCRWTTTYDTRPPLCPLKRQLG